MNEIDHEIAAARAALNAARTKAATLEKELGAAELELAAAARRFNRLCGERGRAEAAAREAAAQNS